MEQEFYSHGKLLLSGEYAILDGAIGLALPTNYGQSLQVVPSESHLLEWTSLDDKNNIWFQGTFDLSNFSCVSTSDNRVGETLQKLLVAAKKQNPNFLTESSGFKIKTKLDFPREWGLGSSSTLINNIAQWAKVDAYQLLWEAFGGSGYDIACAQHDGPITYQLENGVPIVENVSFAPSFKDALYFVYLNKKQSSKTAIANYRKRQFDKAELVTEISSITQKMLAAQTLEEFEILMTEHEDLMSKTLGMPTIQSQLFPDFPGTVKSLGAWGGDFVMVTTHNQPKHYFKNKGYETLFPFDKLILE